MKFIATHDAAFSAAVAARLIADPTRLSGFDPASGLRITAQVIAEGADPLWDVTFYWRSASRRITARRVAPAGPGGAAYLLEGRQMAADVVFSITPLDARSCQISVSCELRGLSIGLRLVLEPLRLAQAGAQRRYDEGVARMVAHLARQAASV